MQKNSYLYKVGNTALIKLKHMENSKINLYGKLEFQNPTGSIKDRSAFYVINKQIGEGKFGKQTIIVESSSGNFGISLAAYSKLYGIKFICVVDPKILPANEAIIDLFGASIHKVKTPDAFGGYLLTRLDAVKQLLQDIPDTYWTNQYGNPLIMESFKLLGDELYADLSVIDYVFIGVSSSGTISGVSNALKEKNENIKIIAVDIEGSVIFGREPAQRYIPGIGSSIVPPLLKHARIDGIVHVSERETVEACYEILRYNQIIAGGSSGSVYAAVKKYFADYKGIYSPNIVCLFADKGERYLSTIFNREWVNKNIPEYNYTAN